MDAGGGAAAGRPDTNPNARTPAPVDSRRRHRPTAAAVLALLFGLVAAACGDEGPEGGPGTLTATLTSANAADGAALVELRGAGIQQVTAVAGRLFHRTRGDTVRVLVVRDEPGPISFALQVADTTRKPIGIVLEVADGENRLRSGTGGYSVELGR